ncbi:MAG: hypothetical protein WBG92_23775 [Thiohalocapsa sp.]
MESGLVWWVIGVLAVVLVLGVIGAAAGRRERGGRTERLHDAPPSKSTNAPLDARAVHDRFWLTLVGIAVVGVLAFFVVLLVAPDLLGPVLAPYGITIVNDPFGLQQ